MGIVIKSVVMRKQSAACRETPVTYVLIMFNNEL